MTIISKWRQWAKKTKTNAYALYLAYQDPRTPWFAKIWTAAVVAYAVSPIDLIPDFIPIVGYVDDLILVPLGIIIALKLIPKDVFSECKETAQSQMAQATSLGWGAGIVIVIIWVFLVVLLISWIL